ncbi:SDR family oxidoreductase [Oscillatoriales cyanobacterium LEGE 11467]|uniref:SDR family oxidoreductase n=1 Tax=Zarconia navalis LEGE 11467 TaxID=1828826 RepID=A0A928Z9J0_9CYAN|nr:SDR family NAD(P)-dependent oxidoreductase [Zarconia navalis]MBE9041754.1 SDR family oxidoreductase [Zarconia navalis LEGE 11467]
METLPSRRFEGKTALLTGGGSGIGRASALRLALEGASIALVGRTLDKLVSVCEEIEGLGGKAIPVPCDVTRETDCQKAIAQLARQFEGLDVLVTSAGIHGGSKTAIDTPEEVWDLTLDTDLKGAYLISKFAIPQMHRRGGGAIVHISSIGGLRGSREGIAFQAAKGGLINLTRHMAIAHAAENIRTNCICPGVILTPMTQKWLSNPQVDRVVRSWHPLNRIGRSEEVAAAVAFLASEEASFITGAILPVDGGYLAAGPGSP